MGLSKQERQSKIVETLMNGEGTTGTKLSKRFSVSKGTILKDISELRKQGYPIQVSSMKEEGGAMAAWYEIPRFLRHTSAAFAGRH